MPRCNLAIRNGDYIDKDFSRYVKGLDKTNAELGQILGVTGQAVSRKINHECHWKLQDAARIFQAEGATARDVAYILGLDK